VAHSPLGQIPWPPPGRSRDRQRAGFMSGSGQFLLALDKSTGMALPAFRMIGVLRRPGHVTQGPSRAARAAAGRSEAVALTVRPVSAARANTWAAIVAGMRTSTRTISLGAKAPRPSGWSTGTRRRDRDLVVFAGPHSPHLLPSITSAMSLRCAGQTLISSGSRLVRPTDRCRLPPRPTPIPERVAVGVPDSDGCGEECVTCGAVSRVGLRRIA
jgi:hypothetical protein